jgi:hypothetical protein
LPNQKWTRSKIEIRFQTRRGNGWLRCLLDVLMADMEETDTKKVGAGKTQETVAFPTIHINTGVFWLEAAP